jgi:hypothetical protein
VLCLFRSQAEVERDPKRMAAGQNLAALLASVAAVLTPNSTSVSILIVLTLLFPTASIFMDQILVARFMLPISLIWLVKAKLKVFSCRLIISYMS